MAMFIQSKADSAKNTSPVKTEQKDLSFTKDYMNDTPFINSAISDNKVVFVNCTNNVSATKNIFLVQKADSMKESLFVEIDCSNIEVPKVFATSTHISGKTLYDFLTAAIQNNALFIKYANDTSRKYVYTINVG